VAENNQQQSEDSRPRWVLDAAILTTLAAAAFYVVGHLVRVRDSLRLGIPIQLLPEIPIQQQILVGGLHIFWLCLVFVLIYFIALLFAKVTPAKAMRIRAYCVERFRVHPNWYRFLGLVLTTAAVVLSVPYLLVSDSWPYSDQSLPKVVILKLKTAPDKNQVEDIGPLLYLSHRDKWLTLKRDGSSTFLILKDDDVINLELEGRTKSEFHALRGIR
jgi:hypothetical protein